MPDLRCEAVTKRNTPFSRGLDEAKEVVAAERKTNGLPVSSETQVGTAWAERKVSALVWLAVSGKGGRWTQDEHAKIRKIYADAPGIVLSGERAFAGRHTPPKNSRRPKKPKN